MSTSRKTMPVQQHRPSYPTFPLITKPSSKPLKLMLLGLLMMFTAITSGCASGSKPLPDNSTVAVDASLMVKPNLTTTLLNELSK